jgi:acetyl esterase/lipase
MTFLRALLLVLSIAESLARVVPIRSEQWWPVATVGNEIAAWFIVLNLAGAVWAWARRRRVSLAIFLVGFFWSAWPFVQIGSVNRDVANQWTAAHLPAPPPASGAAHAFLESFTGISVSTLTPQALPLKIQLYEAAATAESPAAPRPIVINIHGGSWQHGSATEDGVFATHLATQGYAVFSLDYRRAPEHHFPAQIDDVQEAIRWVYDNASRHGADAARIALAGRSAGGHLAMLAAYAGTGVPIRSVISYYGPTDLEAMHADPPSPDPLRIPEKLEELIGTSPSHAANAYRDASPVHYVRAGLPPTLQIQGARDRVVKARFPRELHERLLASGVRSLLLELPWADHSFDFVYFGPGSTMSLAVIDAFLAATL